LGFQLNRLVVVDDGAVEIIQLPLPAIREALRDRDPVVRQGIAEALGSLGGRAAGIVADLQILLDDAKPSVRKAAVSAIKRIGV
jgi:HEAT repeat protein